MQHARIGSDQLEACVSLGLLGTILLRDGCGQSLPLRRRQPARIRRLVIEVEEGPYADDGGQQSFDHKHPLPALQSSESMKFQKQTGKGTAENEGKRGTEVKKPHNLSARVVRKPIGQVEYDAREESSLGCPEQKAHGIEGD